MQDTVQQQVDERTEQLDAAQPEPRRGLIGRYIPGLRLPTKLLVITLLFVMLAVVNEAVWRTVDTDTWVSFKAFGIPVLVIIFSIIFIMPVVQKHQITDGGAD